MKKLTLILIVCSSVLNIYSQSSPKEDKMTIVDHLRRLIHKDTVIIERDFLYTNYILADEYPYKKGTRKFQWDKIRENLALLDSMQRRPASWGILQNRRNINGQAPLVKEHVTSPYNRPADLYGVEQYQSIPLYNPNDTITPERYAEDGSLVKLIQNEDHRALVEPVYYDSRWIIPKKYIKEIKDEMIFKKVIFVDRENQNITTLEKVGEKWIIRSMDHATTGLHHPPYQHETPLGIFVIQEKKPKMFFYKDGTTTIAGFAPHASRFTNGAYTHGIPVNYPRESLIERSGTLGTTPRSHMCVRCATSHAQFIYDWAPIDEALVFVIE